MAAVSFFKVPDSGVQPAFQGFICFVNVDFWWNIHSNQILGPTLILTPQRSKGAPILIKSLCIRQEDSVRRMPTSLYDTFVNINSFNNYNTHNIMVANAVGVERYVLKAKSITCRASPHRFCCVRVPV